MARRYTSTAPVTEFPKKGYAYATTWADLSPSITLGTMCYHAADGVSRECFLKNRMFNGLMDDFSLFNVSQSDAEIAQKWNASMAERIADGLEPRCARPPLLAPSCPAAPRPCLAPSRSSAPTLYHLGRGGRLFFTTSATRSHAGEIPNLGTAGSDYNALVGKTDGALAGRRLDDVGNEVRWPLFVAADAIPNKQEPAARSWSTRCRHHRRPGCARPARRRTTTRRRPRRDRGARARRHGGARPATACRSARRERRLISAVEDNPVAIYVLPGPQRTWNRGMRPVVTRLPTLGKLYVQGGTVTVPVTEESPSTTASITRTRCCTCPTHRCVSSKRSATVVSPLAMVMAL